MATLEDLGTVLTADLLIVGGGIAGLACAISAKETDPEVDVLVLDKVVAGWGGKANKGGGNISYVTEEDGFETFLRYHVAEHRRTILEDQDLLLDYVKQTRPNLDVLERWGVHIYRDDAGEPKYVRWTDRAAVAPRRDGPGRHPESRQARAQARRALPGPRRDRRPAQGRRARLRRHRLRHARRRVRRRAGRRRGARQRQPVLQADAPLGERRRRGHRRRVPRRRRRCAAPSSATSSTGCSPTPRRSARAPRTCSTTPRASTSPRRVRPDDRGRRALQGGRRLVEGDEGRARAGRAPTCRRTTS